MTEPYEYELTYRYKDLVSTVKFSAEIELSELKERLKTFLASASWTEKQLDFLGEDEDA